jgi:hypothetical protein
MNISMLFDRKEKKRKEGRKEGGKQREGRREKGRNTWAWNTLGCCSNVQGTFLRHLDIHGEQGGKNNQKGGV